MELNLINLKVRDWPRMVAFYHEVIGLAPVVLEPDHEYGWLDAGNLRLAINGGRSEEVTSAALSLQFQVDDLIAAIRRLESLGCDFFDKQLDTGELYRMAQFRDPEGNAIAIYEMLAS